MLGEKGSNVFLYKCGHLVSQSRKPRQATVQADVKILLGKRLKRNMGVPDKNIKNPEKSGLRGGGGSRRAGRPISRMREKEPPPGIGVLLGGDSPMRTFGNLSLEGTRHARALR